MTPKEANESKMRLLKVIKCNARATNHICECEPIVHVHEINHRIISPSQNVFRIVRIDGNTVYLIPERMDVIEDLTGKTLANLGEPLP